MESESDVLGTIEMMRPFDFCQPCSILIPRGQTQGSSLFRWSERLPGGNPRGTDWKCPAPPLRVHVRKRREGKCLRRVFGKQGLEPVNHLVGLLLKVIAIIGGVGKAVKQRL